MVKNKKIDQADKLNIAGESLAVALKNILETGAFISQEMAGELIGLLQNHAQRVDNGLEEKIPESILDEAVQIFQAETNGKKEEINGFSNKLSKSLYKKIQELVACLNTEEVDSMMGSLEKGVKFVVMMEEILKELIEQRLLNGIEDYDFLIKALLEAFSKSFESSRQADQELILNDSKELEILKGLFKYLAEVKPEELMSPSDKMREGNLDDLAWDENKRENFLLAFLKKINKDKDKWKRFEGDEDGAVVSLLASGNPEIMRKVADRDPEQILSEILSKVLDQIVDVDNFRVQRYLKEEGAKGDQYKKLEVKKNLEKLSGSKKIEDRNKALEEIEKLLKAWKSGYDLLLDALGILLTMNLRTYEGEGYKSLAEDERDYFYKKTTFIKSPEKGKNNYKEYQKENCERIFKILDAIGSAGAMRLKLNYMKVLHDSGQVEIFKLGEKDKVFSEKFMSGLPTMPDLKEDLNEDFLRLVSICEIELNKEDFPEAARKEFIDLIKSFFVNNQQITFSEKDFKNQDVQLLLEKVILTGMDLFLIKRIGIEDFEKMEGLIVIEDKDFLINLSDKLLNLRKVFIDSGESDGSIGEIFYKMIEEVWSFKENKPELVMQFMLKLREKRSIFDYTQEAFLRRKIIELYEAQKKYSELKEILLDQEWSLNVRERSKVKDYLKLLDVLVDKLGKPADLAKAKEIICELKEFEKTNEKSLLVEDVKKANLLKYELKIYELKIARLEENKGEEIRILREGKFLKLDFFSGIEKWKDAFAVFLNFEEDMSLNRKESLYGVEKNELSAILDQGLTMGLKVFDNYSAWRNLRTKELQKSRYIEMAKYLLDILRSFEDEKWNEDQKGLSRRRMMTMILAGKTMLSIAFCRNEECANDLELNKIYAEFLTYLEEWKSNYMDTEKIKSIDDELFVKPINELWDKRMEDPRKNFNDEDRMEAFNKAELTKANFEKVPRDISFDSMEKTLTASAQKFNDPYFLNTLGKIALLKAGKGEGKQWAKEALQALGDAREKYKGKEQEFKKNKEQVLNLMAENLKVEKIVEVLNSSKYCDNNDKLAVLNLKYDFHEKENNSAGRREMFLTILEIYNSDCDQKKLLERFQEIKEKEIKAGEENLTQRLAHLLWPKESTSLKFPLESHLATGNSCRGDELELIQSTLKDPDNPFNVLYKDDEGNLKLEIAQIIFDKFENMMIILFANQVCKVNSYIDIEWNEKYLTWLVEMDSFLTNTDDLILKGEYEKRKQKMLDKAGDALIEESKRVLSTMEQLDAEGIGLINEMLNKYENSFLGKGQAKKIEEIRNILNCL